MPQTDSILLAYNNIMRKDQQRSRAAQSNALRSSMHIHQQSYEEASSQLQNARVFSSLSWSEVPDFSLSNNSKNQSYQMEKVKKEQFQPFLQNFGRESELKSSCISNEFEENGSVCHRSWTSKKDSYFNIANQQYKQHPKFNQQSQFNKKPQMVEFSVQTDFPTVRQMPNRITSEEPLRKRDKQQKEQYQGCYQNLVFTKFDGNEQRMGKKYPKRMARECARLKFWMGEKMDYAKGGYWRQKE